MKKLTALVIAALLMLPAALRAQLPSPTYGWNLGNTMEPPSGEGTWAPAATQQLINSVAASGFNTIRIPVAWNSHANQRTLQIDPAWLARVKQVVDWSRAANLTVIINSHWDNGWFDSSGFTRFDSKINKKVQSYWTQIATTFKTYDSGLIFACANEPAADTQAKTNVLTQYYQTFVNAVRATGGNNTTRWLALQGPNTSIDYSYQWFSLPSDPTPGRLIVEIHYYDPFNFTMMTTDETWGNRSYFWGQGYHSNALPIRNCTWGEEDWLVSSLQKMKTKYVDNGVPVMMGEFGSIRRTAYPDLTGTELNRHLASRTYFDKKIVDLCNQNGVRPIYWDDGGTNNGSFGLYDRTTAALVDVDSAVALTGGGAVPPPPGGF